MRHLLTQGTLGDGAAQVPSEQMDVLVRSLRWEESSHSPGSREGGTGPTSSVGNRESENGNVSRQQPGPGSRFRGPRSRARAWPARRRPAGRASPSREPAAGRARSQAGGPQ